MTPVSSARLSILPLADFGRTDLVDTCKRENAGIILSGLCISLFNDIGLCNPISFDLSIGAYQGCLLSAFDTLIILGKGDAGYLTTLDSSLYHIDLKELT